ncbi:hypothetical protein L7F22_007288 [Adiantum nelumboides]|nr:hypothetical protein [Adiantum nelumboides]
MHLLPREKDKIFLHQVGSLAQKRLARGVRLNQTEATALIASVLQERIRDGKHSVAELMQHGKTLLGRNHVLPGVESLLHEVMVEGTFHDGCFLVTVHDPICTAKGNLKDALYGSFLPVPNDRLFGPAEEDVEGFRVQSWSSKTPTTLSCRPKRATGDEGDKHGRPADPGWLSLSLPRDESCPALCSPVGHRLPSGYRSRHGSALRARRRKDGADGQDRRQPDRGRRQRHLQRSPLGPCLQCGPPRRDQGPHHVGQVPRRERERRGTGRSAALQPQSRGVCGPVRPHGGDKVRLADSPLWIEVERDMTAFGDECKFGGGKVLRDGMGQMTERPTPRRSTPSSSMRSSSTGGASSRPTSASRTATLSASARPATPTSWMASPRACT